MLATMAFRIAQARGGQFALSLSEVELDDVVRDS